MTLQRRTPLRKVSLKKEEEKRLFGKTEEELRKLYDTSGMHPDPSLPGTRTNKYGTVIETNSKKVAAFLSSGLVQKASEFTSKPRKNLKARSPNNKGGQKALFGRIWDNRPHKCEVCGAHIEEATASNFSHLLPKGTYPDFKLREDNIVIKCHECHDTWHKYGPHNLMVRRSWLIVCAKYFKLSREANNVNE